MLMIAFIVFLLSGGFTITGVIARTLYEDLIRGRAAHDSGGAQYFIAPRDTVVSMYE